MTEAASPSVPLSGLDADEKARRASAFGAAALDYERYRPGPPLQAVESLLPSRVQRVVDLGAGTGALTRLLVNRAAEVVAVEPDHRMREVLVDQVSEARVLEGRGESIPLPDRCADAVLASSSWHWMDVDATLAEVGRILRIGGTLAAMWTMADPEGFLVSEAQKLFAASPSSSMLADEASRPAPSLEIPAGAGFSPPIHRVIRWDVALNGEDLIGLIGTFSWVINMPADQREALYSTVRELVRDGLGLAGEKTVDVAYCCDLWSSTFEGAAG